MAVGSSSNRDPVAPSITSNGLQVLNLDEVRNQISGIPNDGERKVTSLLHDIGLDFVRSNVVLRDYPDLGGFTLVIHIVPKRLE